MAMKVRWTILVFCIIVSGILICCNHKDASKHVEYELIELAQSERLWTGVAVSQEGRIFVNFPRWSTDVPVSVAEVKMSGEIVPYPDMAWSGWTSDDSPEDSFVCVQSVFIDNVSIEISASSRIVSLDAISIPKIN